MSDIPTPDSAPQLSPSEEFRLAHPDFVEPTVQRSEWDPNTRRASQQQGSGGGFAAGLNGELVNGQSDAEMDAANEINTKQAEVVEATEPDVVTDTATELKLAESTAALQHRLSEDTRRRGLGHVARLRAEMTERQRQRELE